MAASIAVLSTADPAAAQRVTGIHVSLEPLKRSTIERTLGAGPVMVGPQSALEFEWRLLNNTGEPVEMPSPAGFLRLRVSAQGRAIPVRTDWAENMTVQTGINRAPVATTAPRCSVVLPDLSSLSLRGSTRAVDGTAFAPGEYVVDLGTREFRPVSTEGAQTLPLTGVGFPIQLRVVALDSPERWRQFHLIEGGFYRGVDNNRALEHFSALVSLPGSSWTDSLALAWTYGDMGNHRDACAVIRRILPDFVRALDGPLGRALPGANLRRAARSCAADGDVATAAHLLKREGLTPLDRIPAEIEQLRKSAPKPGRGGG